MNSSASTSTVPLTTTSNPEKIVHAWNGWLMLVINLGFVVTGLTLFLRSLLHSSPTEEVSLPLLFLGIFIEVVGVICLVGHFTLQPNEARVMILFGSYHGTVRTSGFFWANPFFSRIRARLPLKSGEHAEGAGQTQRMQAALGRPLTAKISLRARNFNSEKLKVNDKRGNPVEIAAVIVWRVEDCAKAAFDVDDFESYVQIQSESAIRHIASMYSYDHSEENELTLRDSADEVAQALQQELRARLQKAGVGVDEARLTHLAYAPEIAQAMLRRQQAEAVIAARTKIVHGAVSMVEMALRELSEKAVVEMDEERKAAMVSNLLVVLCSESTVSPVVNTGTLYN
jgi:regulator of protease activity HflC (stomatin/prohibitin superfamily)